MQALYATTRVYSLVVVVVVVVVVAKSSRALSLHCCRCRLVVCHHLRLFCSFAKRTYDELRDLGAATITCLR